MMTAQGKKRLTKTRVLMNIAPLLLKKNIHTLTHLHTLEPKVLHHATLDFSHLAQNFIISFLRASDFRIIIIIMQQ